MGSIARWKDHRGYDNVARMYGRSCCLRRYHEYVDVAADENDRHCPDAWCHYPTCQRRELLVMLPGWYHGCDGACLAERYCGYYASGRHNDMDLPRCRG